MNFRKNKSLNMRSRRSWECWIKYWRADGKACQQKKPAGSADSWLANVKKMKDRTQKKHCSDVVPDGVFLL